MNITTEGGIELKDFKKLRNPRERYGETTLYYSACTRSLSVEFYDINGIPQNKKETWMYVDIPKSLKICKTDIVRRHLLSGKTLSPGECIDKYNYLRLASLVNRINKRGKYQIENLNPLGGHANYKLKLN